MDRKVIITKTQSTAPPTSSSQGTIPDIHIGVTMPKSRPMTFGGLLPFRNPHKSPIDHLLYLGLVSLEFLRFGFSYQLPCTSHTSLFDPDIWLVELADRREHPKTDARLILDCTRRDSFLMQQVHNQMRFDIRSCRICMC